MKTYKEGEFKEWENKKRKTGQKLHEETCVNVSPFLLSSKAKSYMYFRKLYWAEKTTKLIFTDLT